jgi:hypothetical protein
VIVNVLEPGSVNQATPPDVDSIVVIEFLGGAPFPVILRTKAIFGENPLALKTVPGPPAVEAFPPAPPKADIVAVRGVTEYTLMRPPLPPPPMYSPPIPLPPFAVIMPSMLIEPAAEISIEPPDPPEAPGPVPFAPFAEMVPLAMIS